jgi:CheY-like chemotaxis protein
LDSSDLKSETGVGSTFILYLPATRDVKQELMGEDVEQRYGNGERILIVDDVEEQREIATAILEKLRYTVFSAQSGEDALEFLKQNDVDLVLLDMIMHPGIDGVTTYKQIRRFKPNQKAIIVSGFSVSKHVDELQGLGVNLYIKKPYSIRQIGEAVKISLVSTAEHH